MQNKYSIQYLLIPLLLIGLTTRADLFLSNLSGITHNLKYYLLLVFTNTYLIFVYYPTIKQVTNRKLALMAVFAIFIVTVLPYFEHASIISTIHVMFGYIGFTIFSLVMYQVIIAYSHYSFKKSQLYRNLYLSIMMVVLVLYLKYMAINGIMELIYLIGMNMILWFIDMDINK